MGSTVYTQKLTHPVQVTFKCEHCGETTTFIQNITGTGSADVPFLSSNKYTQSKITKVGKSAQRDLERKIQTAQADDARGKYSWLNLQKCSKCKYYQTWQTTGILYRFIGMLLLLALPVLLISVWIDLKNMTLTGLAFFIIFIGIILLPFVNLIVSLIRIDRAHPGKPTVTI